MWSDMLSLGILDYKYPGNRAQERHTLFLWAAEHSRGRLESIETSLGHVGPTCHFSKFQSFFKNQVLLFF
jgi:hypothetical protein